MSPQTTSFAERAFRILLRLFPADFRGDYGREMEQVFREQQKEANRARGSAGVMRVWWETLTGIFRTAPSEHLSMLRQDITYGVRMLRKNPIYALLAIFTLTLGIGANTAIFSVIRSVLLRPLPYRNGSQLVVVQQSAPGMNFQNVPFSVSELNDYRAASSFSDLVEYHGMNFILFGKDNADRVKTGVVSARYFDVFGVTPILGRTFVHADEEMGAPPVLLLSYEYWQQNQHGDPNIVGKTFTMNDKIHTVIGVLPPVPQYPDENDVYMPVSACPFRSKPTFIADRDSRMMSAFALLKPGVTVVQANAELKTIASRLEKAYPKSYPLEARYIATDAALQKQLTRTASPTLMLLFVAAAFVLLIACANVANLTLARMARRERELVLRSALGAGRSRVLRQLVTEGLLIALPSALLGLAFAGGSLKLLTQFTSRMTPRAREIRMDIWVLAFAIAAAIVTSIVFGSLAAFCSRENVATDLKESTNQSTSSAGRRMHGALIVAQVAFSFIVLVGAGLTLRSFYQLSQVDPGFRPERVLAMNLSLNWQRTVDKTGADRQTVRLIYSRRLLSRLEQLPGMVSVAVASGFPLAPDSVKSGPNQNSIKIDGYTTRAGETVPNSTFRAVSPAFFSTLGIPLIRGRYLSESDTDKAAPVVVINQALADKYWPNLDPIGRKLAVNNDDHWETIVGVVGNVRDFGIEHAPERTVFGPMEQFAFPVTVMVRTSGAPNLAEAAVRQAIRDVDPETAISGVISLTDARRESLASPRVTAELLVTFGALALVIAVAGVGGVLALAVSQRVREIGIRMALGAERTKILRMVMGEGLGMVAIGLVLGCAGALALTRLFESLLFGVPPRDPFTYVGVAVVFLLAAIAASYVPARRAMAIDPIQALRSE
ncbi:MAG TPA: ABC transporter permease [Candidatus Acidoferrales bacterium]|nr:ABC transporter permease [Candidatus Acidoferrales bacterium]